MEGWRDIPGFEGLYRASDKGNIYSCTTNKIITPWINNRGYYCIKLYRKNIIGILVRREYKVHQLVCLTYKGNERTRAKNEVHHRDFNKLNNCIDNLEWCTRKRNMKYNYERKTKQIFEEEIRQQLAEGPF